MANFEFHQLVHLEKGPVNTAVFDFLKGNVYQVPNHIMEHFLRKEYEAVPEFIQSLKEEELVIKIEPCKWIPRISFELTGNDKTPALISLDIEEGADLKRIADLFGAFKPAVVRYYGENPPGVILPGVSVIGMRKNHSACMSLCTVSDCGTPVEERDYRFNIQYNSCWGKRIAVTGDNNIRPCIYSRIVSGNIETEDINTILKKAETYWKMTKEKNKTCKDCELRYYCFNCLEIPFSLTGDLNGHNPYCSYSPYTGSWSI